MNTLCPLYPDNYYHIYNRGNNHQTVFFHDNDYRLFLERMPRFIEPIAEIFAFCLLPNHFHLLVQIKPEDVLLPLVERQDRPFKIRMRSLHDFLSDQFSNWFNSFTRSMNNRYNRDGNLFKRPFQRKQIGSETYLLQSLRYIHRNAQLHGLCADFRQWKYSSYASFLSEQPTRLQRAAVLEWFGGLAEFRAFHEGGFLDLGSDDWVIEG